MTAPFHFKDGQLHCEDINLEGLFTSMPVGMNDVNINGHVVSVEVPPTPAFVYSTAALTRNVDNYREAMAHVDLNCRLGYALKANGNHAILKTLKEKGVEMLVSVSGNEILAGLQAGFAPGDIIFNGNGKQEWEIKLAITTGVLLNVDSVFDAHRIADIKRHMNTGVEVQVLLRIRPSVLVHKKGSTVHPYVNTAEASKFGFDMKELDEVLDILCGGVDSDIKIHGIHCHLGSCIYDPEVYRCMGGIMRDMAQELEKKGHVIKILDIGGGIGIDYHKHIPGVDEFLSCGGKGTSTLQENKNSVPDAREFMTVIADIVPKTVTLILEPGRSLVANAGAVICKVLGTKAAGQKRYAVVDASMSEIIRPCLYDAFHQIYATTLRKNILWEKYDVVGPICETADFLGRDIFLQKPDTYLAIMDVGAYCSSMSSNYNMRPRPVEMLVDGTSWKFIRTRDTFSDLVKQSNSST